MRIRRQAQAHDPARFAAEAVHLIGGDATLEEGACVDPRRRVTLDVDLVARSPVLLPLEEVVEADVVELGGRRVRRQVPAEVREVHVRPAHHYRGVPADDVADAGLDLLVAGVGRLVVHRDGVDVVRREPVRGEIAVLPGTVHELGEEVARPVRAGLPHHGLEGLEPVRRLGGVFVFAGAGVERHGRGLRGPRGMS